MKRFDLVLPMKYEDIKNHNQSVRFDLSLLCGVYFLIKDQEIVYVGQSTDIASRIKTHIIDTDKDFDEVYFIEYSEKDLIKKEFEFILAFEPKLNKTYMYEIELNRERQKNYKRPRKANGQFISRSEYAK